MGSSRVITPWFGTLAIQLVLVILVAWARSSSAIGISRSVSSRISHISTDQPGGAMWAVRMDRGDKFLPEIGLTLRHGHIPNGHLEVESVTVNGAASEAGVTVGDVISDPVPETALVRAIESAAESRRPLDLTVLRGGSSQQVQIHPRPGKQRLEFGLTLQHKPFASVGDSKPCAKILVVAVRPNSIASRTNITAGDFVLAVDGVALLDDASIHLLTKDLKESREIELTIARTADFSCEMFQRLPHLSDPLGPHGMLVGIDHAESQILAAADRCDKNASCVKGHLRRIEHAVEADIHRCIIASSRFKIFFSLHCDSPESEKQAKRCRLAKEKTDAEIARVCEVGQRNDTCAVIEEAWKHEYQNVCDGPVAMSRANVDCAKNRPSVLREIARACNSLPTSPEASGATRNCALVSATCTQLLASEGTRPVCASNGTTFIHPCKIQVANCMSRTSEGEQTKTPLVEVHNGTCKQCRTVALSPGPSKGGIGMETSVWQLENHGHVFQEVRELTPGSLAERSRLIYPGDLIVNVENSNMCNVPSSDLVKIFSVAKTLSVVKMTVCTKAAVAEAYGELCPKSKIPDCDIVHVERVGNSLGMSLESRRKACGMLPTLVSAEQRLEKLSPLLTPANVILAIDKTSTCNMPVASVYDRLKGHAVVELLVCASHALKSPGLCGEICPAVSNSTNLRGQNSETSAPAVAAPQHEEPSAPLPAPPTIWLDTNQEKLAAPTCKRVKIRKSQAKFGIDIVRRVLDNSVVYTIHRKHAGRAIDDVDLRVGDQLIAVDDKSVDGIGSLRELERLISSTGDTAKLQLKRGDFDIQRTVTRDILGFGFGFVHQVSSEYACGAAYPVIDRVDTLMHGMESQAHLADIFRPGALVVQTEDSNACGATLNTVSQMLTAFDDIATLQICPAPSGSHLDASMQQLCSYCGLSPKRIVPRAAPRMRRSPAVRENISNSSAPAAVDVDANATECRVGEVCPHGRCPSGSVKSPQLSICIETKLVKPALAAPVEMPDAKWERDFVREVTENNSSSAPQLSEIDPLADVQLPGKSERSESEPADSECSPGGYCLVGRCPLYYRKNNNHFCVATDDAPRDVETKSPKNVQEEEHVCVPGHWCPPGWRCPPGYELQTAAKDGFCFESRRAGPFVAPEFVGARNPAEKRRAQVVQSHLRGEH